MRRRPSATLFLVFILTFGLAACAAEVVPQTPKRGGTLRVALRDLETLDPAAATGRGSLLAVAQVFDSLTALDPRTSDVVPAAAESWTVSADGRTWTFVLRPARFHDGSTVTAADFKFSLDRIARKATGSDFAFLLESVAGFRRANAEGAASGLEGVVAEASDRLVVRLERPDAELGVALAHPALGPVPAALFRGREDQIAAAPVGNGPFKVASFDAGRRAVLETAADGVLLDRVELTAVQRLDEAWQGFLQGESDIAVAPADALGHPRAGRTGFGPLWGAVYFGPNLALTKYRDPAVRRAISLAIDRAGIAQTVYAGAKDPATGLLPRGVRGYLPDACSNCVLDREQARVELDRAPSGASLAITVDHLDAEPSRSLAAAVVANLRAVGIRASARPHTQAAYRRLLAEGRHDFAELGWLADVPAPDQFLAQQLGSKSPNNATGFGDRAFDQFLDRARAEEQERARLAVYRQAEARALDLMPLIPVVFFRNQVAVSGAVRGLVLDGAQLFDAATVWLAD